jgi:hypothetical protein
MVSLPRSHRANFDFRNRAPVPPDMELKRVILFFARKHKAEFDELSQQLYDPKSPHYHHWLSREEIHQRFGETRAEFNKVERWLRTQGFKIDAASFGGGSDYIQFTGTAAHVEAAFHVKIVSAGPGGFANARDVLVPARFQGVIGSIVGLDNFGSVFSSPILRPIQPLPSGGSTPGKVAQHDGMVEIGRVSSVQRPASHQSTRRQPASQFALRILWLIMSHKSAAGTKEMLLLDGRARLLSFSRVASGVESRSGAVALGML